jgi:hypothetical protein
MRDIQTVLKAHRQLHGWSCAASAHEFIAKIHEKIDLADYPLQNDPASQRGGFQFEAFLNSIGFTGHDDHLPPPDAAKLFATEIAQQRFPLVSILAGIGTGSTYWHIVVAVPSGAEVALADPAKQALITQTTAETLTLLQAVVVAVLGRDKIHFLTYRDK